MLALTALRRIKLPDLNASCDLTQAVFPIELEYTPRCPQCNDVLEGHLDCVRCGWVQPVDDAGR